MKRTANQMIVAFGTAATLFAAATAFAQTSDVGLRMEVDKRQVEVGETVTLTLEFRQVGVGNVTTLQEPAISTPEHFEIRGSVSSAEVHIVNQQTAQISKTRLTLVATKPGTEVLGPAVLIYQDAQLQKREIKSNVASVTVVEKAGLLSKKNPSSGSSGPSGQGKPSTHPPPPTVGELKDIKPLLPESNPLPKVLFWLVLLGLIGGFLWRHFSKRPGAKGGPPPLGRVQQLKEAWKRLGKDELSAKEFCLGLSSLVRECIEFRFGFPAVDYTTEEVLRELKKCKVTDDEMVSAEKCLKACDRVLYADGNLTGRDNLRAMAQALLPKINKG